MRKAFNVRPKQIEKKNLDQSRQKKKKQLLKIRGEEEKIQQK